MPKLLCSLALVLALILPALAGEPEPQPIPDTKEVLDKIAGLQPGWTLMLIKEPPKSPEVVATLDMPPVTRAIFTPDGKALAVWVKTYYAGIVPYYRDPRSLAHTKAIVDSRQTDDLSFSPDGTLFATAMTSDFRVPATDPVKIYSTADGKVLTAFDADPHVIGLGRARFGADSKTLYCLDGEDGDEKTPPAPVITVWSIDKKQKTATLSVKGVTLDEFVISPNGKWLAAPIRREVEAGGNVIQIWTLPDNKADKQIPTAGEASDLTFSPDSSLLGAVVNAAEEPAVQIFKTADWSEFARVKSYPLGAEANVQQGGIAISPDNKRLAFFNNTAKMVSLVSLPGGEPITLLWAGKLLDRPGGSVVFSPDGNLLITAGRSLVSFDLTKIGAPATK